MNISTMTVLDSLADWLNTGPAFREGRDVLELFALNLSGGIVEDYDGVTQFSEHIGKFVRIVDCHMSWSLSRLLVDMAHFIKYQLISLGNFKLVNAVTAQVRNKNRVVVVRGKNAHVWMRGFLSRLIWTMFDSFG
jgi:hypothetical protein